MSVFYKELEQSLWKKSYEVAVGDKNVSELLDALALNSVKVWPGAEYMMQSSAFNLQGEQGIIRVARLRPGDLGLLGDPERKEFDQQIEELDFLGKCPHDAAAQELLQVKQRARDLSESYMERITGRHGRPRAFVLGHDEWRGLWLYSCLASPDNHLDPDREFVVHLFCK